MLTPMPMLTPIGRTRIRSQATPPGSPLFWYEADNGVFTDTGGTTPATNNDAVARLNDQSANAYNVTQSTEALKPTFKTGELNGLPALSFDGGDALTRATSNISFTGYTIAAIIKPNSSANVRSIVSIGSATGPTFRIDATGKIALVIDSVAVIGAGSTTVSTSAYSLCSCRYDGSAWSVRLNGTVDASGTNARSMGTVNLIRVGRAGSATLYMDGYIAALVFYNSDIGSSNMTLLEAYLNGKYVIY